ncbi:MAG TPA: hypothetical protein VFV67_01290 [Actinophytocola sp.]|uniref:hypothetical protein n=1 Tax=Actinophytocola sp. TaxID=1872138 RepID=UPI002DBAE1EA|nr:hypothetical protein [Actinophytocola sp.]HEU5469258.1 hypothetical protein [Actinophytocola sp.]
MSERISEIVAIIPRDGALYLLFVDYEEGDGGNGVGHIQRTDGERHTVLEAVLSTNDILRAFWGSPTGALWASSEDGNVWTSASVRWPEPRQDGLDSVAHDPTLRWTVTTLPDLREEGYAPTLGPLWGTGDADVFVAVHRGHIYQWNGEEWRQTFTAPGEVRAFAGTGPHDVYAVGENATLLHYDGNAWSTMENPAGGTADETFTGCCIGPDGALLACSMDGRLLHGTAGGLIALAHDDDLQLYDVATLDDRVILTAGRNGVVEFRNQALVSLRDTFHALKVTAGKDKLYFVDATSEPVYIEYDPAHPTMPWARISF